MRRWPFACVRYLVTTVAFAQRFPLYLVFVLGFPVMLILYFVLRIHRLPVYFLKAWLGVFFLLNGVRIQQEKGVFDREAGTIFLCNYFSFLDYAILFYVMPYPSIVVMDRDFFKGNPLRKLFYLMGFYPSEGFFDVHSYQSETFRMEPYLDAGVHVMQPFWPGRHALEGIPYGLMLGIKRKVPVVSVMMRGNELVKFSSLLSPKRVEIRLVDVISANRRRELMVAEYMLLMKRRYMPYESSRRYKIARPSGLV